jgi:cation diffusion facilitator family transporter
MDEDVRINLGKKASAIALTVNVSLMVAKVISGILSKSTAIVADAFNNGTDIFATIAVFSGIRVAHLPPDEKHHYGHIKAESIVSKIVSLLIIITSLTMGYSSITKILSRTFEAPGISAMVVSIFSIAVKYSLFRYTNRVGKLVGSSSMVADSYNHRSDVLASISVLLGVAGARLGYPILDPLAGILVSLIILKTGISIYLEAIEDLMDTAPDVKTVENIKSEALNVPGVITVNQVRARKLGQNFIVDLKICVDGRISVEQGHLIAVKTKHNIIHNCGNVQDVMVHVNPCSNPDNERDNCNICNIYNEE